MPIYTYSCENGHERDEIRTMVSRSKRSFCREEHCGKLLRLTITLPAITRLEPIPMDRSGHSRRAAKRREKLTGEPSQMDYNSATNNNR